ncbi:hypothetical protein [Photobacterium damselae]|uniref:hypothetical protein n=1 Tax=Photobacterium damselae TaxID=38293 RepID=UPI00083A78EC|nr:hypothetical protein [Photobacterium damselae]ODA24075.1 hypothetical protein A0J46_05835 [Photobacterium damselae subsp. damselae]TLS70937.1 hypothetical protein FD718_05015 [Photobacterium damselae subsp. damselae]
MKLCKLFLSLGFFLSSVSAQAFIVDSMVKFPQKDSGNGMFTLNSNTNKTEYINVSIDRVKVKNNKLEKTPYTRENFPMWDLATSPGKLVLHPGEAKDVAVKFLCQKNCHNENEDLVYQINFIPVNDPTKKISGQKVNMLFGMAPYYIIPAKHPKIDYKYDYNEKSHKLTIQNTGNTYLNFNIDNCKDVKMDKDKDCSANNHLLAGRTRSVVIPKHLISRNTLLRVSNHDESFLKKIHL